MASKSGPVKTVPTGPVAPPLACLMGKLLGVVNVTEILWGVAN